MGAALAIVSDANSFFIDTILARNGIAGLFDTVITNPAYVEDDGASGDVCGVM